MVRLRTVFRVFRLALPKFGIAWMFALLSANFNRVTIHDLVVPAVLITVMTGMHHFFSPFQVVFGRLSDRYVLFGYRRTPAIVLGAIVASLTFLALPAVARGMGAGSWASGAMGFALLAVFGIGIAATGDGHHALIADVTTERQRGATIAFVWTFLIVSTIASAIIAQIVMPTFDMVAMQRLYNLSPLVVVASTLLGVLGIEKRLRGDERALVQQQARAAQPEGGALRAATATLRTNAQARAFFGFIFLAILAIFLQDNVLEVFGADMFNMTVAQTTGFTKTWGGGALLGMVLLGVISAIWAPSKKLLATLGGLGTALGLGMLALAALSANPALINPALLVMGFSTGCFNVGALAMMMDMTIEGSRGLYMGMWGMAQAFGTGLAAALSGGLHTALIEQMHLAPSLAYLLIFGGEALLMVASIGLLRTVSVQAFKGTTPATIGEALALEAA